MLKMEFIREVLDEFVSPPEIDSDDVPCSHAFTCKECKFYLVSCYGVRD